MLKILRFTADDLSCGCVTDAAPVFAFQLESGHQDVSLASATLKLGDWTKQTDSQTGVRYDGPALSPFTTCEVTLEVTDNRGESAKAALTFDTGRLDTPWQGRFITDGAYRFTAPRVSPVPMNFRKSVRCTGEIARARLYMTAMGVYEMHLNGEKVGEDYFAPGFTSYRHQLQYQVYDVTGMLREENELACTVAGGWAVGSFTYKRRNRVYARRQSLLAELRIEYTDGRVEVIPTDETWQVSMQGPWQEAEFYNGEVYDATFDAAKADWHAASVEIAMEKRYFSGRAKLLAQYGLPVRAHEEFKPVKITRAADGTLVYDMGQNFAGVIRAKIRGRQGQKITFTHAEILMDGALYREPLRTAKQEAVYICREGEQEYSPRLTYMGFRYVGVTGIDEQDIELSAVALYSDVEENGSFRCDNELVNRLQNAIRWGARSNFVDIPTDCPQRDERMGWTGDIALFAPTAAYNFRMGRFLRKWLMDLRAEQNPGGGFPVTVPLVRVPMQWEIMIPMAVDHWGDAGILVPWAEYRARGDLGILRENYAAMKRYLKACQFWAGLLSVGKHRCIWQLLHHYGDWCAPNVSMWGWMGRGRFTATACMAHSAGIVAEIAELLGEKEDAACFRELKARTSDAYRSLLMDENCRLKNREEFQTGYILPLHYGMLNEADRKKTAANLARLIRENDYHIGTGFPGTPFVLFALADNGYVKDAYRMLLTDTCPSWLYEMKTGGTTIWERWDALREDGTCNTGADDGTGGMVSFNHYASGAVGDFLYRRAAGIEAIEGGYRRFRVKPILGEGISRVEASVGTAYGEIRVNWAVEDGQFTIEVDVPVSTQCELTLPGGRTHTLGSGHYIFCESHA